MYFNVFGEKVSRRRFKEMCEAAKNRRELIAAGLTSRRDLFKMGLLTAGGLLADGLTQVGLPRPVVVEAYNVEKTTHAALAAGGSGQGTLMGNLLQDTVVALGGAIIRWEPVPDGSSYHLRVHVAYP